MTDLTICFATYINAGMVQDQCRRFRALPDNLKKHLRLVIVDDCSPTGAAQHEDIGFPFKLFRMKEDIRWNQDACRNLAVANAETDWVLITDIDHIPPMETLARLVGQKLDSTKAYQFSRDTLHADGTHTPYLKNGKPHHHPNSWFMHKDAYWRMGGYDERLRGNYGTDGDMKRRLIFTLGEPIMLKEILLRVPREVIADASTTTLKRKSDEDAANIKLLTTKRNNTPGWQPKHFLTPWERVK